jgi:hypothetical protein
MRNQKKKKSEECSLKFGSVIQKSDIIIFSVLCETLCTVPSVIFLVFSCQFHTRMITSCPNRVNSPTWRDKKLFSRPTVDIDR